MIQKKIHTFYFKAISSGIFLFVFFVLCVGFLRASDLTSTNFIIRDAVFGTGSGYSSSTNFNLVSSGNINVQGYSTSASFINEYGFLYYPGEEGPSISFALSANGIALGTLSSSGPSSGSHTVDIATNASSGFSLSMTGDTLTSSGGTVSAIGNTPTTSSSGTSQFGVNLRDNTTPNVGADVTQNSGTCSYGTGFGTVDNFKFNAGTLDTVASASAPADCVYTISYIANISTITPAGSYSTTLDIVGTGNF